MRLSTSTLGCPNWDLSEILKRLREYGYDGVDFRGLRGEMALWRLPEFGAKLAETAARIRDSGLAVSGLSSGIRLTDTKADSVAAMDEELARSAEICAGLGCSYIRVFGGALKLSDGAGEAERPRIIECVAERAARLAERARSIAPVSLALEAHDDWSSSQHVAAVLQRTGSDAVGCCWDVKHPYWAARETPAVTFERLRPWINYTHWKDARRHGKRGVSGQLALAGEGIVPLTDCFDLLRGAGYDGWLTLEWEKKWQPEIEEPEVAFPQFVVFMRGLAARYGRAAG